MDRYLQENYLGKYRIKAHYCLDTNDFPRDYDGTIDDSFADFYIDCRNHIEIKHVCPPPYGREHYLACYIPNKNKGINILRQIYKDKISHNDNFPKDKDKMINELIENNIIKECDLLDCEVLFEFSPELLDYVAPLVNAKTSGAKIQPLSSKNLPKRKSLIPDNEMKKYKKATNECGLEKLEKAQFIMAINKKFESNLPKKYKDEMKKLKLDFRNYVYYKKLWDKYLMTIKNGV